jgi:hypothetical protein
MRARRMLVLGLVLPLAGLGLLAGQAGAATPSVSKAPTGNPKTIAFYRQVVAATAKAPGWTATFSGYTAIEESIGKQTSVNWEYYDGVPKGYDPAVDHVTAAAAGGRLTWLSDEIVPAPRTCAKGSVCFLPATLPYQVLLGPSGLEGHFVASGPASLVCWAKDHGAVLGYSKVGVPTGYGLYGRFYPMRRAGGAELVTSTYPWGATQHATEVDTISIATHLPSTTVVHVSASPGHPALTLSSTYRWLGATPAEPATTPACP